MQSVTLGDAKLNLPQLVERAAGGERIAIESEGQTVALLVPADEPEKAKRSGFRPLGLLEGKVWMEANFDDPLPADLQRAFDGEGR